MKASTTCATSAPGSFVLLAISSTSSVLFTVCVPPSSPRPARLGDLWRPETTWGNRSPSDSGLSTLHPARPFASSNGTRNTAPMDVAGFLAQHHPFDGLERDRVATIAGSALIEFFPAGTTILEQDGAPTQYLYVIRSGAVEVLEDGRL